MNDPELAVTDVLGARTVTGPTGRPRKLRIEVADRNGRFCLVFDEHGARQLVEVLQGELERWRLAGFSGPMA